MSAGYVVERRSAGVPRYRVIRSSDGVIVGTFWSHRSAARWIQKGEWRVVPLVECRISEEWCGQFIGRRACSTHQTRWDDGGPCPGRIAEDES